MPGRTVDIVATGPPPLDPYDGAASAWGLAAALAADGDDVRVLHLPGSEADATPAGVTGLPVEIPLRRPGASVEPAEFATAVSRRLRKAVDLVLRDPVGLGSLGYRRGRRGPPLVGGFVRGVELRAFEGERQGRPAAGFVDRLDTWRDRRAVRRLERAALDESDRLFYDVPEVAKSLTEEYGVSARKLIALPPGGPRAPGLSLAGGLPRRPSDPARRSRSSWLPRPSPPLRRAGWTACSKRSGGCVRSFPGSGSWSGASPPRPTPE